MKSLYIIIDVREIEKCISNLQGFYENWQWLGKDFMEYLLVLVIILLLIERLIEKSGENKKKK